MNDPIAETIVRRPGGYRFVIHTDSRGQHWLGHDNGRRHKLATKGPHQAAVMAFVRIGDKVETVACPGMPPVRSSGRCSPP